MMHSMRKVADLWKRNYLPGSWCAHLYDEFLKGGLGKDFDTISFWIGKFKAGKETSIIIDYGCMVEDGNHRLVAAKIVGIEQIGTDYTDDPYNTK